MKLRSTNRGFLYGEFTDRNGKKCSIQKSSLATEDCIWLGVDFVQPRYFVPGDGWKDVELPPKGMQLLSSGRMHLTRRQVARLLPALMYFVKTGDLPARKNQKAKR